MQLPSPVRGTTQLQQQLLRPYDKHGEEVVEASVDLRAFGRPWAIGEQPFPVILQVWDARQNSLNFWTEREDSLPKIILQARFEEEKDDNRGVYSDEQRLSF